MPTKEEIYSQIQKFNQDSYDINNPGGDKRQDKYFFVDTAFAKERGLFLKFLLENGEIAKIKPKEWMVFDLAFGSGSLTSHLIFETDLKPKKIVFNDKNFDPTNPEIDNIDNSEIFDFDFLDSNKFPNEKFNLVVFNPQIGIGRGKRFDSEIKSIEPKHIENGDLSFEDFLNSQGVDTSKLKFQTNEVERTIEVTSKDLGNSDIFKLIGTIRVYNYYEVRYKSDSSEKWKNKFNHPAVKFRRTFDKIFDAKGILVFYGEDNYFRTLFSDFHYVIQLCPPDEGKMLFVATKAISEEKATLYRKSLTGTYEITDSCKEVGGTGEESDLDELNLDMEHTSNDFQIGRGKSGEELSETPNPEAMKFSIVDEELGSLEFPYLNVLLKGVPGTGKSRLINQWINKQLDLKKATHPNVLRINVHSASSNADLMQGIGIAANKGQVEYHEKTGLVLNHLKKACEKPKQPFVLVLEEIQENSLNELIGDLIYLIEDSKRVDLRGEVGGEFASFEAFVDQLIEKNSDVEFVQVPFLVNTETKFRNLIFPKNLYVFCTSNYRDDKKVVEDNLMRRFDLIELYPRYESVITNPEVSAFLETLNHEIITGFESREIHPDRLIIGHANWIEVNDEKKFCRALLKAVVEFKDIREIEWSEISPILQKIMNLPFGLDSTQFLKAKNYKELIERLQEKAFEDLLNG